MHIVFLLLFSLFVVRGDTGSCLDPEGGCRVRTLGDDGSGLDPHGGRVTGQGDLGPGMDPWG